jgi:predicted dehydrogenase
MNKVSKTVKTKSRAGEAAAGRAGPALGRRTFLAAGAGALASACAGGGQPGKTVPSLSRLGYKSPNEKLNVAGIGAGGKGYADVTGCESENIVALCDVDFDNARKTFERFPEAAKFRDFREMLEKEKSIDAVTITTADHTHYNVAMAAMQLGKHVYLQKPLTRTIAEARRLTEAAGRYKVATQMGNQGHSGDGVRKLCEMIWSGAIGAVREVHAWTDRPIWPQGIAARLPPEAVPQTLAWDLWLGPAAERPFNKGYTPFKWRGWWDFGCGALGDMGCHILDPAHFALRLGAPKSVECVKQEGRTGECYPQKTIVKYDFAARGSFGPVTVYWYDGGWQPPLPAGLPEGTRIGEAKDGKNGSLFIGEKGIITTGMLGEGTRLLPDELMNDYKFPEPVLTRSPGHYRDWIRACKGGEPACSSFEYAGPLTEWVLLGALAQRFDGRLEWDPRALKVTNRSEANAYVEQPVRKGWEV